MACTYCRHFNSFDEPWVKGMGVIENVRQEKGVCTLSPDWREVTGLHTCSQLSPTKASLLGDFWTRMHESYIEAIAERKLRREAEAKLKKLRGKLRALKVPATVADRQDAGGEDR